MKFFVGLIVLLFALMVIIPASAQDPVTVNTGVSIQTGGGSAPIVKAKMELEPIEVWESGDPTHAVPGTQILPPCVFEGQKAVYYAAVVTDEEDNGNVKLVFADVYHPDGSFKYQVNFYEELDKETGIDAFMQGARYGLVAYNRDYDYAEVLNELEKGTAAVWIGVALLDYCQMDGDYRVDVTAIDQNDNYSDPFTNYFLYVPVACAEFDFTAVNYGSVAISRNVWRAGDVLFGTADKPTVRNIGNTPVRVKIQQSDMGFGKDNLGYWMVCFDARLGMQGAEPTYCPNEIVTLPDILDRSHTEELDFSIHVYKGTGRHTGQMTLGVERAYEDED